jgi:hypothetical protein
MDVKDWTFLGIALAQTGYAAATFHRDRLGTTSRPAILMLLFTLLTWGAVGFDVYTRPALPAAVMVNYGVDGPTQFHGVAQLTQWENYKDHKALLITRTMFGDRDRQSDEWIAKSTLYTIEGPIVSMIAITQNQMHFAPGQLNFIEYNFAVLPPSIATSQIRNLGDVGRLGGKILAVAQQGIPLLPLPETTGSVK